MSVLRILAIGDPHVKVSNLGDIETVRKHALELIEEHQPHLVVVLGDVLHNNASVNSYALVAAVGMLRDLARAAPRMILLIGNHDRPNCADFLSDVHPFTALAEWPTVTVVDKVRVVELAEQFTATCVPYVPAGRFMEALSTHPASHQADIIFCHQDFHGAHYSQHQPVTHGDKIDLSSSLVISGHIHAYQRVGAGIIYVGTPMQHDFGEDADKALTMFYFTRTAQPGFEARGNFFWRQQRFNSRVPQRLLVKLPVAEIMNFQPPSGARVKVEVHGTPEEFNTLRGNQHLRNLEKAGVAIKYSAQSSPISPSMELPPANKTYLETLRENLDDPAVVAVFNEIFS